MTQSLARITFYKGNWDQTRIGLQRAEALRRQAALTWPPLALSQGRLALAEGARDEAAQVLEDCATTLERSGWLELLREAQSLLAELDLLEGRPEVARARLIPLLDRPGVAEHSATRLLAVLAWAHLELGELAEAERVVSQAIMRMRADNDRLDLVNALRVQAMIALRQVRWAEAERSLEEGLALARTMPYPYAEGRLLHVYGELHVAKGEPVPARERLEAALAIFQRLGARKDAERADADIANLQQNMVVNKDSNRHA
jgi:tetratricopeptide (TPR) repeat protein